MIKYDSIKSFAKLYPNKIALKDDHKFLTWRQFQTYVAALIVKMEKVNISNASSCLFISNNNMNIVLLGAAFTTLSIPFQGIDYHLDVDVIMSIVRKISVSHVFVSREFKNKFNKLEQTCQVYIIEDFVKDLTKENEEKSSNFKYYLNQQFRAYSFTSGTTGVPKIVYRTVPFDARRFEFLKNRYKFNVDDVHLACLPMYHVSSTGWLKLFLSLGCTVIIHHYVGSYQLCETLYTNKVTTTIMSPIMLKQITDEIKIIKETHYFWCLRFLITGGKNCSLNLKNQAISKLGNIIHEYYGTTETGVNTLLDPDETAQFPGSVGKEFDGNKIIILNEDNIPVPSGEIGRIAVSGYMNMDFYLNHPTDSILIENQKYLITMDYGYKNEQGYLYIFQRSHKQNKNVHDLFSLENEVLSLNYILDVHVHESNGIQMDIVPKYYHPYSLLKDNIAKISKKYGIKNLNINIVSKLSYTPTGKIKLFSSNLV